MNLHYWGIKMPQTAITDAPATALPVMSLGPACLTPISSEILAPTDSAAKTLTVPDGAVMAKVQVNGSAAWYTTDGDTPVIATVNGFKIADTTIVDLWGKPALDGFIILAHTSGTPKVYVEYYKFTEDIVS